MCEVKNKIIDKLYKKSRLMIQSYNDTKKVTLLIQTLKIQ